MTNGMKLDWDELVKITVKISAEVTDEEGNLKLLPSSYWLNNWSAEQRMAWCNAIGMYLIPTKELVEWIQRRIIKGRKAIEVGAGHGELGRFLGIPSTDNYSFLEDPEIIRRRSSIGLTPPIYSNRVEKLEALEAVNKYKPEVVIASWVDDQYDYGKLVPYGINEVAITEKAEYLFIGHEGQHTFERKAVFKKPHRKLKFPWLLSRPRDLAGNAIWHFQCQQ